jgi:deazaflavin-dependent oxidoreductase (nitroreductase family)
MAGSSPWLRFIMSPAGARIDKFFVRWFAVSPLSRAFARASGIQDRGRYLLLVTKGRISGKKRSTSLSYFEIDGRFLVVGSGGGAPEDPHWVRNLRADPNVTIYVDRRSRGVRARIAEGEEHALLWGKLVAGVPTYSQLQKQAARQIPLVIFE